MEKALKILKEKGWYLTVDGIKKVDASLIQAEDWQGIIENIINLDFRDIAGGALPIKPFDHIPGPIVLQLQKSRNISAPKSNEESKAAPRFLQLELIDGQKAIQALELEHIPSLSLNMPPGTKIYFRAVKLQLLKGFLVLRGTEIEVLGGNVPPLVLKWELARNLLSNARGGHRINSASGPPSWIAFGQNLYSAGADQQNSKSLQPVTADNKESKENEDFKARRNAAIAEATKAGTKKVFGGGGRQMIDHNLKKILEKGYSDEDAKQALRTTNNNLERALYNLKRGICGKRADDISENKNTQSNHDSTKISGRNVGSKEMTDGKRGPANLEEAANAKPMAKVTLYDFLTSKLSTDTAVGAIPKTMVASACPSTFDIDAPHNAPKRSKNDDSKVQSDKLSNYVSYSQSENHVSSRFAATHWIKEDEHRVGAENFTNNGARRKNNQIQYSPRSKNYRFNESNNQNHNIRNNFPSEEGPVAYPIGLAHSVEVKDINYHQRRNRGGEGRYCDYTGGNRFHKRSEQAISDSKLVEATSNLKISDSPEPTSPSELSSNEQFSGAYMHPVAPYAQGFAYVAPNSQAVQTLPPIPNNFGMIPGDAWQWKIGDICFAKYSGDGQFYEAQVNAIFEKICIVVFLAYGNHEAVLKTDCLPITDSNFHTVNVLKSEGQHPSMFQGTYFSQQKEKERQNF